MSRTLKYILGILLIGATAWWLMTVYRSCERTKKNQNIEVTDTTGDDSSTNDSGIDDLYEDDDEDDTSGERNPGTNAGTSTDASGGDTSDAANNNSDDGGTDDDDDSNRSSNGFANGGADIAGEYLVVAGAFISKRNAEQYQKQLNRKGYESERRVFLGSDYHSVIIGNFETESAARAVRNKIGGEAYVHKKRYLKKRR